MRDTVFYKASGYDCDESMASGFSEHQPDGHTESLEGTPVWRALGVSIRLQLSWSLNTSTRITRDCAILTITKTVRLGVRRLLLVNYQAPNTSVRFYLQKAVSTKHPVADRHPGPC